MTRKVRIAMAAGSDANTIMMLRKRVSELEKENDILRSEIKDCDFENLTLRALVNHYGSRLDEVNSLSTELYSCSRELRSCMEDIYD